MSQIFKSKFLQSLISSKQANCLKYYMVLTSFGFFSSKKNRCNIKLYTVPLSKKLFTGRSTAQKWFPSGGK